MSIKKLAGQTIWYGLPTIASRFIGYILNFSLAYIYHAVDTADLVTIYAIIPFLNILFTYGVETSYFRFVQDKNKNELYSTLNISVVITTICFTGILLFFSKDLARATYMPNHPEYFRWIAWIIFFDTLSTLPFAKLRQEGRPRKYAFVRIFSIIINVLIVIYFLGVCPAIAAKDPKSILLLLYYPTIGIGYYLIGNLIGSMVTFILLWKEFSTIKFAFNGKLWKEVMKYSYPLIIVGLGGMINEMLSRLVYQHVIPISPEAAKEQLGIFGANYRLAVLITIFIQMFRMAAEPFFFNQSQKENAKKTYARVMKFFVIACCCIFLVVGLYLDVFQKILTLKFAEYGKGIHIVPILALGNVFLGIYYNLSVWYKLTNKNWYGAAITIAGAVITVVLNIWWIPKFGYTGSAWATFTCYFFMMVSSYLLGQKFYRIPYARKKLVAYLTIAVLIYFMHKALINLYHNMSFSIITATVLFVLFIVFIARIEKKEFQKLPMIGKFFGAVPVASEEQQPQLP
ncbi:MAG TPA: polysaccharide biosynthesis C-terminal domain-containing protein [Chitinophagaceae bacterium]|nr:polysaccharide biosynthesis C-terminal domain-containing protein [Chitinophagaceae bacterium]